MWQWKDEKASRLAAEGNAAFGGDDMRKGLHAWLSALSEHLEAAAMRLEEREAFSPAERRLVARQAAQVARRARRNLGRLLPHLDDLATAEGHGLVAVEGDGQVGDPVPPALRLLVSDVDGRG